MSDCLDDNTALELIDGKLPSARRTIVERHIESCDACRELVVELAQEGSEADKPVDTQRPPETPAALSQAGPYRIEREVGSGAAGTVFRAIDERDGQVVALKYVTDPAWRARFAREVETLARLVHPGIVRYVSHGETRQGLYLAMEWLDGEDLGKCMDRGPLPWPSVRALGLRLAAALAHAHALGAVHRDINPRNIFLPQGRLEHAKLLDFGLVRVQDTLERTHSQAVLGTPHYMAPEQVKDPRSVDPRSDLFALGVVFYEALAGGRPFDGDDLFTIWLKIVDQPAPDLRARVRDVPEAFLTLIERMMAKDPAGRPASAAVLHEALVRLDAGPGGVSTAVTPPISPQPPPPMPAPVQPPSYPQVSAPPPMMPMALPTSPPPIPSSRPNLYAPPTSPPPIPSSRPTPYAPPPPAYGSGPVLLPFHGAVTAHALPPAPAPSRTGLLIGAAALVAGAIVVTGGVVAFALHSNLVPGSKAAAPTSSDEDEVAQKTNAKTAAPAPAPSPATAARPGVKGSETLFCGGEALERRRGGNYQPDPDFPEKEPVIIGGDCKAVLEDCVIGGHRSINLTGKGDLTLRRCRVQGTTQIVGEGTLTLEGTTLPSPPKIVGKGRVLRR